MLVDVGILLVGLVFLMGGGELLVRGASSLARSLGVSPLAIGLTVVAFGTSAPELAVNIRAAIANSGSLAFGNIFGSNMANIGLIVAMAALITPLPIKNIIVRRELPMMLLSLVAAAAMAFDIELGETRNEFTRSDGLVLLLFFVIFMYYTVGDLLRERTEEREANGNAGSRDSQQTGRVARDALTAMVGLLALLGGARATVGSAVELARVLEIPEAVIGLTMVSIGTSLPELVAAMTALRRKQLDIAVGGVVGSNIFNTLLVMGVTATIRPIEIPAGGHLDLLVTMVLSLILLLNARSHKQLIIRTEGGLLLAVYLSYMLWRVLSVGPVPPT
jgi:cation:H+ antiporter